jgi:hypothetical protein
MRLLRRLRRRVPAPPPEDPTRFWLERQTLRIDVELDPPSVCGVRLGDPMHLLSGLGPADDPAEALAGAYLWFRHGLEAEGDRGGRLRYFAAVWRDQLDPFEPFRGTCTFRGRPVHGDLDETGLRALLGEPWHATADGDDDGGGDVDLWYEPDGVVELHVELADGLLQRITVSTPPVMAQPDHRARLGATGPWPPDGSVPGG